jgi:hypothetical protein
MYANPDIVFGIVVCGCIHPDLLGTRREISEEVSLKRIQVRVPVMFGILAAHVFVAVLISAYGVVNHNHWIIFSSTLVSIPMWVICTISEPRRGGKREEDRD